MNFTLKLSIMPAWGFFGREGLAIFAVTKNAYILKYPASWHLLRSVEQRAQYFRYFQAREDFILSAKSNLLVVWKTALCLIISYLSPFKSFFLVQLTTSRKANFLLLLQIQPKCVELALVS